MNKSISLTILVTAIVTISSLLFWNHYTSLKREIRILKLEKVGARIIKGWEVEDITVRYSPPSGDYELRFDLHAHLLRVKSYGKDFSTEEFRVTKSEAERLVNTHDRVISLAERLMQIPGVSRVSIGGKDIVLECSRMLQIEEIGRLIGILDYETMDDRFKPYPVKPTYPGKPSAKIL